MKKDNEFAAILGSPNQETALDFLDMFAEEEEAVLGFPSIQALTHVQKSPTKIKKENPWGFFVSADVAEMINFTPDTPAAPGGVVMWEPITFYSSADTPFNNAGLTLESVEGEADIETHTGFVSHGFSFHVVAASATEIYEIETASDGRNRYNFVDVKWRNGSVTKAADLLQERTKENRPTHRWVKRYLLKLVDKAGNPLHDGFIQYKAHGGAGGAFSYQVSQYFGALTTAYSKARQKRIQPGPQFKALCRCSLMFDIAKVDNATIGYLDPCVTVRPVDTVNKAMEVLKRDKKTDLRVINRSLASLVVNPNSELGGELIAGTKEYSDYGNPPTKGSSSGAAATQATNTIEGHIVPEMTQITRDGGATTAIDTGDEFISFHITGSELAGILDQTADVAAVIKDGELVSWSLPGSANGANTTKASVIAAVAAQTANTVNADDFSGDDF